jgi:hypothetical protein
VRVPPLRRRFARLVLPAAAEAALDGRAKILMFFGGRLAG